MELGDGVVTQKGVPVRGVESLAIYGIPHRLGKHIMICL